MMCELSKVFDRYITPFFKKCIIIRHFLATQRTDQALKLKLNLNIETVFATRADEASLSLSNLIIHSLHKQIIIYIRAFILIRINMKMLIANCLKFLLYSNYRFLKFILLIKLR